MSLEKIINDAWEIKDQISPSSDQNLKNAISGLKQKRGMRFFEKHGHFYLYFWELNL